MNFDLKDILKRTAQYFIFGNIIISICTASLVLLTYLQLGQPIMLDSLAYLVFFSTLFLYSFHRLMGIRRIVPEQHGPITGWASRHQFSLFILALIGAGGAGFFVFRIKPEIFFILTGLGAVSMLYELPLVKYHKSFQRIRNLWMAKIFLISGVWVVTTALLPSINSDISLLDYKVWFIIAERMLFVFILALCFDSRDVEYDKKDNLKTIPILYGDTKTKELYNICTVLFFVISGVHYFLLNHYWGIGIAMIISIFITHRIVMRTFPRRSDYYYLFAVDGMMIVQLLLVLALMWLR